MSTSTDTQKKYVWVSFITYSPFIWLMTGRTYTHAAIGLDGENGPFYSFRYRGFGREYFHADWKGVALYRKEVSEHTYIKIQERIALYEAGKEDWKYSHLGMVLGLLKIPHRIKRKYYCSQFVSEVLLEAGLRLNIKDPSVCMPGKLADSLVFWDKVFHTDFNRPLLGFSENRLGLQFIRTT